MAALQSEHSSRRHGAVQAIGHMPAEMWVTGMIDSLLERLEDADEHVRSAAVLALGRDMPDQVWWRENVRITNAVLGRLQDGSASVRGYAMFVLGKLPEEFMLKNPHVVDRMLEGLTDAEHSVKQATVEALAMRTPRLLAKDVRILDGLLNILESQQDLSVWDDQLLAAAAVGVGHMTAEVWRAHPGFAFRILHVHLMGTGPYQMDEELVKAWGTMPVEVWTDDFHTYIMELFQRTGEEPGTYSSERDYIRKILESVPAELWRERPRIAEEFRACSQHHPDQHVRSDALRVLRKKE